MRKRIAAILIICLFFSIQIPIHATSQVDTIISTARSLIGSQDYNGYCQAFVRYCYEKAGIYASTNANYALEAWNWWGISTSRDNIPIGACMYFDSESSPQYGHVAIYVGNNKMIHALGSATVNGVQESDITSYWWNLYKGWGYQAGVAPTTTPTEPDINKVICTTHDASNITTTSATLSGTFTNPSGARIVQRGYQWGKTSDMSNYTMFDCNITWDDGLTHNMTGLEPNTTYYYKLVVKAENGTFVYGNVQSFKTASTGIENVICTTYDAYNITATSATLSGTFTNPSGAKIVQRGYQWGKTSNMPNYTMFDCSITWDDGLTHNMTGLEPNTTYYYKLVVKGEYGNLVYGNVKSFTTIKPKVYTVSYDSNGGIGGPSSKIINFDNICSLSNAEFPTREKYVFKGWSENKDATVATYTGAINQIFNKDLILYAVWEIIPYTETERIDATTFKTSVLGLESGCNVFLSLYNNGILVDLQFSKYDGGNPITFTTKATAYNSAKVMVWNSLNKMQPLCNYEIVDSKSN